MYVYSSDGWFRTDPGRRIYLHTLETIILWFMDPSESWLMNAVIANNDNGEDEE